MEMFTKKEVTQIEHVSFNGCAIAVAEYDEERYYNLHDIQIALDTALDNAGKTYIYHEGEQMPMIDGLELNRIVWQLKTLEARQLERRLNRKELRKMEEMKNIKFVELNGETVTTCLLDGETLYNLHDVQQALGFGDLGEIKAVEVMYRGVPMPMIDRATLDNIKYQSSKQKWLTH